MKYRKSLFRSKKGSASLPLAVLASIAVLGMSGCTWESNLYDEFVEDGTIVPCPPRLFVYDINLTSGQNPFLCELDFDDVKDDGVPNCVPKKDESDKQIDSTNGLIVDNNGEYKYNGVIVYTYSAYLDTIKKNVLPQLSYIDGQCTDREQCISSKKFSSAFEYNICPKNYPTCELNGGSYYCKEQTKQCTENNISSCKLLIGNWIAGNCENDLCIVEACSDGFVPAKDKKSCVSSCGEGKHYDNAAQSCVDDNIDNCGSTNYACSKNVANWVDGICNKGICNVNECADGNSVAKDKLSCVSSCKTGEHYDNDAQKCLPDDVDNCGSTGYACSVNVAEWVNGSCDAGICKVSECSENYKPHANALSCVSNCVTGQHYDSEAQKCVNDDTSNCGSTGYNCTLNVAQWVDGECKAGICKVSGCSDGFTPAYDNNSCVSSCDVNKHYDNAAQKCVDDDLDNCGATDKKCSETVTQWVNGRCEKGICKVEKCADGFKAAYDELSCVSNCETGKHYDNVAQSCVADDNFNCGATGYSCSEKVAQWVDGTCIAGVCTVSNCETGYKVKENKCVSDCKVGEHYDSGQALCVADDIDNCGATGYVCKNEIKNSSNVKCDAGKCIVIECNTGYKVANNACASSCTSDEYYDSAASKCQKNSLTNCGMKGYSCAEKVDKWEAGTCEKGVCTLSACSTDFKVVDNACKPDCGKEQHYNTSTSQCENNDLNNCGAVGYKCSEKVAHWSNGSCIGGVCILNNTNGCEDGYKVVNNACASDCKTGEHYDSSQAKCVADDINNCGATGHVCKDEIKNSKDVSCTQGKCIVSKCASGYTVNNNVCTSSCTSSQYYDSSTGKCANSSIDNCGMKGYKCSEHISNWATGDCTNNACVVTACGKGYKVSNNACAVTCSSEQHYNTSISQCENNDLNNCGAVGYKCSENVAQWSDGSCVAGVCMVTKCESGYKVVVNACKSDCKTGEHYDSTQATCVADDINNCGATAHVCKDEIKNSKTVSCTNGKCYVSECSSGYSVNNNVCTSSCTSIQYYDSSTGKCANSSIDNCGMKGYKCSEHISNWEAGECTNNACAVTACGKGYKVSNNACAVSCSSEQHYNTSTSQCEDNDLNNCGAVGYKCSEKVAHWSTGSCVAGVCILNVNNGCDDGYKVVNNACASDCKDNEHYDSDKATCVADDVDNCGATGHKCSEEIKNSTIVSCSKGKCSVSACNSGYTMNNNTCVSSCSNSQYYDVTCKTSDVNNCGQKGYKCSEHISNWATGDCSNNNCTVSTCSGEYTVVNNECKADCGTTKYYDSATGSCVTSDLANCGQKGYQCASQISHWSAGSCTANICKVTTCTTGYKPSSDGKTCVSDCKTGQHYDNATSTCVDDDINNCGATGYVCKDEIKNSKTVTCESGKCKVSACESGYNVINNVCTSSCSNTQYYDSTTGQCAASGANNCGQKGYKCSEHVSNWKSGKCTSNACVVETCNDGFAVIGNECKASCGSNQYYDNASATCKASNLQNCGMSGYDCTATAGWSTGSCSNNSCEATACNKPGYHLNTGKCIADSNIECGDSKTNCTTSGKVCINGTCELNTCSEPTTLCSTSSGKQCKNINASDANHCGACNYKCSEHNIQNATSTTCTSGECQYVCTGDYVNVSSSSTASGIQCVNAKTDNNFCGATGASNKGVECKDGKICSNGECTTNCGSGTTLCGGGCVDTQTNPAHCGACSHNCGDGYYCDAGTCKSKTACSAGTYDCGGGCLPAVTLAALHMNTSCECLDGYADNNGTKADGCEPEEADPCATTTCDLGVGTCNAGTCEYTSCNSGYHLYGTTCEANDNSNCGSHGNACGTDASCSNGHCVCAAGTGKVLDSANKCVNCSDDDSCGSGFKCGSISKVCKCGNGATAPICTPSSQTCSGNTCT